MRTPAIASAFDVTVLVSTAVAIAASVYAARRPLWESKRPPRPWLAIVCHPLAQLALVVGLLFVNQVLFNAYVLRVHHGDPSFVARYIPPGWFVLRPHDALVRWVAAHSGNGHLLAPSVLRVQAFLELPFTLFAYLAVARLLGRDLTRTLTRWPLLFGAAISFTLTFSLVELSLPNPWTTDDILLRVLACAVVPPYVAWTQRQVPLDAGRPKSAIALLSFLVGAGAIAVGVLVVYDVFLLYNLGHLDQHATTLVAVALVAAASAYATPRIGRNGSAPTSEAMTSILATFTTLFFVPSLAIRYWLGAPLSLACGFALVTSGAMWGLLRMRSERFGARDLARVMLALAFGAGVGLACALLVLARSFGDGELAIAEGAIAFLAPAIVTAELVNRALARVVVRAS